MACKLQPRTYVCTVVANGGVGTGSWQFFPFSELIPAAEYDRARVTLEVVSCTSSLVRLQVGARKHADVLTAASPFAVDEVEISPSGTRWYRTAWMQTEGTDEDYHQYGVFVYLSSMSTPRPAVVLRARLEFKMGANPFGA